MKLADKKRIPLSQIKLTKSWMDAPEQGVAEGEGNKYGSQENWDSLRKDIRSQYPYKKGTNVTVPHKGKLVNGKIVRYEAGKGGYSPTYVVDIGEYESIMVPPNKVRRDATESLGTTGAMTNGEMGEGKRNLKCVCKTHGTMQCPVHTPKDIEVIEGAKVDRMVKHVAQSEKKLGKSKDEAITAALALLKRFDLADKADQYPDRLSGGQQQRVAIIRSLAVSPRLLLLDEVTSALDPVLVNEVLTAVRDLKSDGMTMVLATHEMGFATQVADEVCFLESGNIVERGTAEQVLHNPQNPKTQEFLKRVHQAGRL